MRTPRASSSGWHSYCFRGSRAVWVGVFGAPVSWRSERSSLEVCELPYSPQIFRQARVLRRRLSCSALGVLQ